MKIESRVDVLENELKILKNEIQSILLELREQVLNHYYPELRAEEPERTNRPTAKPVETHIGRGSKSKSNGNLRLNVTDNPTVDSIRAFESKATVQPFSDLFLEDSNDLSDEELDEDDLDNYDTTDELNVEVEEDIVATPGTSLRTREVLLRQLKQAPLVPKMKANDALEQKPNRRIFAALATWVGTSVAKVGKERTILVVETYAASGGVLTDGIKSSILQLTSLASEEEPTTPVGNQEMLGLMVELDRILEEQ